MPLRKIASLAARLLGRGAPPAPVPAPAPPAPWLAYEAMLEAFYSKLDLAGTEVVDVGAHKGRHTLPLAACVGLDGTCHAFEPIPAVRAVLCRNLSEAGLNNTIVYPVALSDHTGSSRFTFVPNLPEESGLKRRAVYNAPPATFEEIPVKVCRLDYVLPASSRIRFIKIDVEGGEEDVLQGSTRILDESRPIVAFECGAAGFMGYHETPDALFGLFASRGYRIHSILGKPLATLEQFRESAFKQEVWDYVALPEGDESLGALLGRG